MIVHTLPFLQGNYPEEGSLVYLGRFAEAVNIKDLIKGQSHVR